MLSPHRGGIGHAARGGALIHATEFSLPCARYGLSDRAAAAFLDVPPATAWSSGRNVALIKMVEQLRELYDRIEFSKGFGNYRRAVGCGEIWKDLHAERHAGDTVLMHARLSVRRIAEIYDHEGGHLEPRPLPMTNKL
jgi:hypothetical protein